MDGLRRNSNRRTQVTLRLLVLVLAASFAVTVIATPLNRNEHMYLAASRLIRSGGIYGDFAFLQTPYLAAAYGAIFDLMPGDGLLLKGRLCSALLGLGSGGLVYHACFLNSGSRGVALGCLLLLFTSKAWIEAFTESSNYALPIFLVLLAYCLAVYGCSPQRRRFVSIASFGAGLALALAVGTKLTYLALVPPFLVVGLLPYFRRFGTHVSIRQEYLPSLCMGLVVGLLPLLVFVVPSPEEAWYCNFQYHIENADYWRARGVMPGRVDFFVRRVLLTEAGLLYSAVILACLRSRHARGGPSAQRGSVQSECVLLWGSVICGLLAAAVPYPSHLVYFATPVPFGLVLLSRAWSRGGRDSVARWPVFVLFVLSVTLVPRRLLRFVGDPSQWATVAVPQAAAVVRERAEQVGAMGPVATLSPLFALESGLDVYPEFAVGPFFYRLPVVSGPRGSSSSVVGRSVSLSSLDGGLGPKLILTGQEPDAELPLREFAESHGYVAMRVSEGPLALWVREDLMPGS